MRKLGYIANLFV